MSRLTKTVLVGAALVLCSAGLSVAASRELGGGAVYHGCVNGTNGNLRVVDGACRQAEHAISWNETGPAGPQGATGAQGPAGPQGIQGPAGVVSLESLDGTACTRADGSAGTVAVGVGGDDSVSIACHAESDWCAAHTPQVGLGMTVTCDSETKQLTYTCVEGWSDSNHDPADGCESAPLQPLSFAATAAAVLAGDGMLFGGVDTTQVQPDCSSATELACPGGTASSPLPTLSIDMNRRAGDRDRAVVVPDAANNRYLMTGRFRVRTVTPIAVTLPVAGQCALSIDTTAGPSPDLTVQFDDNVTAPDGPTAVGDVVVSGLEAADYSLSGSITCLFARPGASTLTAVVQQALTPWVEERGILCGAPEPFDFQRCS